MRSWLASPTVTRLGALLLAVSAVAAPKKW